MPTPNSRAHIHTVVGNKHQLNNLWHMKIEQTYLLGLVAREGTAETSGDATVCCEPVVNFGAEFVVLFTFEVLAEALILTTLVVLGVRECVLALRAVGPDRNQENMDG